MSTTPPTTPAEPTAAELRRLLDEQRAHAPAVGRRTARQRRRSLQRIEDYLSEARHVEGLVAALRSDFRKHEVETLGSELGIVLGHLRYVQKHLGRWMEPVRIPSRLAQTGITSYIHKEPKGCSLIVAPWNYPFNLTLVPLVYAIAAGCTAVVKPSEFSPATTRYIAEMLGELFEEREIRVVQGGGETAAALTALPFDHIFFTGSPAIGKKVMAAAARNLTSVTLELGGKSPAVIDRGVNQAKSAANTVWGKFFNAGQTCIAPDYLLVPADMHDDYVGALTRSITDFYGADPRASASYPRIINDRHFDRIRALLDDAVAKGATVVCGGQTDRADRYVAPTILTGVSEEMDVMTEEIFGPLWPVVTYQTLDEAVAIINRRPKALSFYVQTNRQATVRKLLAETSSGGLLVNEYLIGGGTPNVPFGGVNNSGIGKSFGYHGFVEFSNERPVMHRRFLDLSVAYPPYTDRVTKLMRRIYKWL